MHAAALDDPPSTRKFIKRVLDLDVDGSFLVTGCDGDPEMVSLEERRIGELCARLGGQEQGRETGENWWANRCKFYYPPFTPMLPTLFGTVESTATFDRIYALYEAKKHVLEDGFKDWDLHYTAHFSHWYPWGTMVYDRFYVEKPPESPRDALLLHNQIWAVAARTNLKYGGTLNDHHGIGFKLGYLMPEQYGAAWDTLVRIKDAIDPLGIMNPGSSVSVPSGRRSAEVLTEQDHRTAMRSCRYCPMCHHADLTATLLRRETYSARGRGLLLFAAEQDKLDQDTEFADVHTASLRTGSAAMCVPATSPTTTW